MKNKIDEIQKFYKDINTTIIETLKHTDIKLIAEEIEKILEKENELKNNLVSPVKIIFDGFFYFNQFYRLQDILLNLDWDDLIVIWNKIDKSKLLEYRSENNFQLNSKLHSLFTKVFNYKKINNEDTLEFCSRCKMEIKEIRKLHFDDIEKRKEEILNEINPYHYYHRENTVKYYINLFEQTELLILDIENSLTL